MVAATRKDANLFSFEETSSLILDLKPNLIINAAAKVGGIHANNSQRTSFITENLKINLNIIESLKNNSEIGLINLGSSCIYPLNAKNPIREEYFMTGPLEPTNSPYALAKISAIEMGRALNSDYGNRVINLMPTNLYGPNDYFHEEFSHVIPGMMLKMHNSKLLNKDSYKVWGTGTPLREFLYVDDLAYAVEHLLDTNIKEDLINVGSGEEVSILELAKLIKDVVGFKGEIIFDEKKPDGNPRKLLDSKIINEYGWKTSMNLREGLNKTYKWFNENYKF